MTEHAPIPAGIIIWTEPNRFEVLVDFYVRTLGMTPTSRRVGHVAFSQEGFRLILGVHDEVAGRNADPLRIMVNLAVANIHEAVARLEGVPLIRPPEREDWGGWIATLSDPDGNTVQLLQLPE